MERTHTGCGDCNRLKLFANKTSCSVCRELNKGYKEKKDVEFKYQDKDILKWFNDKNRIISSKKVLYLWKN